MLFQVEKLPDEPIVLFTASADYDISAHMAEAADEIRATLDDFSEPVHLVVDYSQVEADYEDLSVGASISARGENPVFHHFSIREVVTVTTNAALRLTFEGLAADLFGNVNVIVFDSLDEALGYVRLCE